MVWVNIGTPVLAYINNGGDNNFVQVKLDDTAKNLGAKVEVVTSTGKKITEDFIVGEGLTSDQSATLHFGLGKDTIKSVVVKYISGKEYTFSEAKINTLLTIPKVIISDAISTTDLTQE